MLADYRAAGDQINGQQKFSSIFRTKYTVKYGKCGGCRKMSGQLYVTWSEKSSTAVCRKAQDFPYNCSLLLFFSLLFFSLADVLVKRAKSQSGKFNGKLNVDTQIHRYVNFPANWHVQSAIKWIRENKQIFREKSFSSNQNKNKKLLSLLFILPLRFMCAFRNR